MAWYNPLTLRYEQGEPISSNQSPSASDAFVFNRPGMTTGMGMPSQWGGNPIYQSPNNSLYDSQVTPANNGSWESAAAWQPNFVPPQQAPNQSPAQPQFAPTSAQVQGNPSAFAGTSWGAALLPGSPGNIAAQRMAFLQQPGQASDFGSLGSQPAGQPGMVWDPVSQSYRSPNQPPQGAMRTNNPNVYVLPNGSTWNTPGYSNNVTTDQGYDQFRQQTFGVGNPTGQGIYGNTQGAGAGPTKLGGPGIPYQPDASAAQQALMPQQIAQTAPPPSYPPPQLQGLRSQPGNFAPAGTQYGPQQVSGQYNGSGYPITPGMPGYQYQGQPSNQQQGGLPNDVLQLLSTIFGYGGGGQSPNPYGNNSVGIGNYYGNGQQLQGNGNGGYSNNITPGNQPGGNQYIPTSAWDNFGAQGGWGNPGEGGGRAASSGGWADNAATLNPGQAPSGGSNSSISSQFSQPTQEANPWSGINQLPSLGRSGGLWG